uniref:CSON011464 protein n=1 Tax=Culicoides sonorensis TaxID=179676 RepID=A0A336LGS7_CULSO
MNNQQKTFKFQTFANQMATFDIRKKTLYNIEHKNECFDNENSYFCETIKKWRTLNLTSEFIQIEKDLSNIQNLKQLVFNKEYVCNYLILAFERITDDCLQSFLEWDNNIGRSRSIK